MRLHCQRISASLTWFSRRIWSIESNHREICFDSFSALVRPGGHLILSSPYTWLEEFTPKSAWLGGKYDAAGARRTTIDGIKETFHGAFDLRLTKDLPFLIREHARKFQWSVAQATVWQREIWFSASSLRRSFELLRVSASSAFRVRRTTQSVKSSRIAHKLKTYHPTAAGRSALPDGGRWRSGRPVLQCRSQLDRFDASCHSRRPALRASRSVPEPYRASKRFRQIQLAPRD